MAYTSKSKKDSNSSTTSRTNDIALRIAAANQAIVKQSNQGETMSDAKTFVNKLRTLEGKPTSDEVFSPLTIEESNTRNKKIADAVEYASIPEKEDGKVMSYLEEKTPKVASTIKAVGNTIRGVDLANKETLSNVTKLPSSLDAGMWSALSTLTKNESEGIKNLKTGDNKVYDVNAQSEEKGQIKPSLTNQKGSAVKADNEKLTTVTDKELEAMQKRAEKYHEKAEERAEVSANAETLVDKMEDSDSKVLNDIAKNYKEEKKEFEQTTSELGKTGQFFSELGYSTGQMVPSMVAGAAASTVTGGASAVQSAVSLGTMFLNVYNNAFQEGINKDGYGTDFTVEDVSLRAFELAAVEVATEKLAGGIPAFGGGVLDDAAEETAERVATSLGNKLAKNGFTVSTLNPTAREIVGARMAAATEGISKYLLSDAGKSFAKATVDVLGEGMEEVFSEIMAPYIERQTIDENYRRTGKEFFSDVSRSFLSGAVMSGMLQGVNYVGRTAMEKGFGLVTDKKTGEVKAVPIEGRNARTANGNYKVSNLYSATRSVQLTPEQIARMRASGQTVDQTGNATSGVFEPLALPYPQSPINYTFSNPMNGALAQQMGTQRLDGANPIETLRLAEPQNFTMSNPTNGALAQQMGTQRLDGANPIETLRLTEPQNYTLVGDSFVPKEQLTRNAQIDVMKGLRQDITEGRKELRKTQDELDALKAAATRISQNRVSPAPSIQDEFDTASRESGYRNEDYDPYALLSEFDPNGYDPFGRIVEELPTSTTNAETLSEEMAYRETLQTELIQIAAALNVGTSAFTEEAISQIKSNDSSKFGALMSEISNGADRYNYSGISAFLPDPPSNLTTLTREDVDAYIEAIIPRLEDYKRYVVSPKRSKELLYESGWLSNYSSPDGFVEPWMISDFYIDYARNQALQSIALDTSLSAKNAKLMAAIIKSKTNYELAKSIAEDFNYDYAITLRNAGIESDLADLKNKSNWSPALITDYNMVYEEALESAKSSNPEISDEDAVRYADRIATNQIVNIAIEKNPRISKIVNDQYDSLTNPRDEGNGRTRPSVFSFESLGADGLFREASAGTPNEIFLPSDINLSREATYHDVTNDVGAMVVEDENSSGHVKLITVLDFLPNDGNVRNKSDLQKAKKSYDEYRLHNFDREKRSKISKDEKVFKDAGKEIDLIYDPSGKAMNVPNGAFFTDKINTIEIAEAAMTPLGNYASTLGHEIVHLAQYGGKFEEMVSAAKDMCAKAGIKYSRLKNSVIGRYAEELSDKKFLEKNKKTILKYNPNLDKNTDAYDLYVDIETSAMALGMLLRNNSVLELLTEKDQGTVTGIRNFLVNMGEKSDSPSYARLLSDTIANIDSAIDESAQRKLKSKTRGVRKKLASRSDSMGVDYQKWVDSMTEEEWNDFYDSIMSVPDPYKYTREKSKTSKEEGVDYQKWVDSMTEEEWNDFYDSIMSVPDPYKYTREDEGTSIKSKTGFEKTDSDGINFEDIDPDELKRLKDLYDHLGELFGTQPGTDVPNAASNSGKKTSRYSSNVAKNAGLSDSMDAKFKKLIVDEMMAYAPTTNAKQEAYAQKWLKKYEMKNEATGEVSGVDFNKAYTDYMGALKSGKARDYNDIVKGNLLLRHLAQVKNPSDAQLKQFEQLAIQMKVNATRFGQGLQAFSTLKKLTPDGRLYYIESSLQALKDDLSERKGKISKALDDYTIPDNLLKKLQGARTGAELDTVEDEIIKDIASHIPATVESRVVAWRYLSMLGNARTHERNILSNMAMLIAKNLKDVGAGAMEDVFMRNSSNRTKTLRRASAETKAFAANDYLVMKDVLQLGGKQGFKSKISDATKDFGDNFAGNAVEWLANKNSNALEAEDGWFLKIAYKQALQDYITANNIDVNLLKSGTARGNELLGKARDYALREAQKATYREANALATMLNEYERTHGTLAKLIVGGLVPFKKTPINILKRGYEYSPLGIISTVGKFVKAATAENATEADFAGAIDSLCANLTGTGIFALGMFLGGLGILKAGGSDNDKEEYYDEMLGNQQYSITIGGKNYTLDWLTPVSMPFFAGAELINDLNETEDDSEDSSFNFNGLINALTTTLDPLTNLSLLQGVNEAINSYSDNKLGAAAVSAAEGYASQFIPTLVGQVARSMDDTRRTTYAPKDSEFVGGQTGERFWNRIKNKLPIASESNPEYVDMWGREEKREGILGTGTFVDRLAEQTIVPWYAKRVNSTEVDDQLAEVFAETGDRGVLPSTPTSYYTIDKEKYYLDADEYTQVKKTVGQLSYSGVESAFESPLFEELTSDEQADVISNIYSFAREVAKVDYADANGIDVDMSSDLQKANALSDMGISLGDYYIIKKILSHYTGDGSTKKKREYLWSLGMSDEQVYTFVPKS